MKLEDIEKLLLNIDNINDQEKNKLKNAIIDYRIISRPEYMALYNKLSKEQLKKLVEVVGIKSISNDFIRGIYDFECLIIPYEKFDFEYRYLLDNNPELMIVALNNPIFYQKFKDFYDIESFADRNNLDENVRKVFAENAVKYIPNFDKMEFSYHAEKFLSLLSEETKLKVMKMQESSDGILKIYKFLNDNTKRDILKSDWFNKLIDINDKFIKNDIIAVSPDDIALEFINEDTSFLTLSMLYNDTERILFWKLALDRFDLNDLWDEFMGRKIFNEMIIIPNIVYNELGEYQNKLISIINSIDKDLYINIYFSLYNEVNSYSSINQILYNRAKQIIENDNIIITKLSPNLIKSENEELLDLIIKHVSKSDLLLLSIRNKNINKYVLNLLKEEPKYFEGVSVDNVKKFIVPEDMILNYYDFMEVSRYLNKDQNRIYFINEYIEKSDEIKDIYIKTVKNDSSFLASIKDLTYFTYEEVDNIISPMDINKLMHLLLYTSLNLSGDQDLRLCLSGVLERRFDEIALYINDESHYADETKYSRIFLLLTHEHKSSLINLVNNIAFLCFYYNDCSSKNTQELISNRLIKLYESNDIDRFTMFPLFFSEEDAKDFYDRLDLSVVVVFALNQFREYNVKDRRSITFKKYIQSKLDENADIIFNNNIIYYIDELISYLDKDYQIKIQTIIDDLYSKIENYNDIKDNLTTYSSKANFIYSVNNGYINDNNYNLVYRMFNKNKFLFETMNFRLLSEDLLKMGNYFVNKCSRCPDMSRKVLKIYDTDINKYNLLLALSNKMYKDNNSIYDEKLNIIVNYLINNDINIPNILNEEILINIENFILDQYINYRLYTSDFDCTKFLDIKNKILNEKLDNCNDIVEYKNLIFQKYFGLNKNIIDDFLRSFVTNWDSVKEFNDNSMIDNYILLINSVNNVNDLELLKEIRLTLNKYNINDYMNIKSSMISAYNKSVEIDIKSKQNGIEKTLLINGVSLEVTELVDDFGIFINSTNAYRSMPLINNDYYDSWNYNPNTKNHGICTSYITNSVLESAPVKDTGVIFGFTNIDSDSIPLMAPYDLMTKNDGFIITSVRRPYYGRLNTINDYTRHMHNETSLERYIYKDGVSYIRQPDCIVIFEDMDESIKANSIKAYEDYKKHGIELKIIYIDRVKVAHNEASKINAMIVAYEMNYNLYILKELISKYNSNMCWCSSIGSKSLKLINEDELFNTKYVEELLYKTVDYIESTNNNDLLNEFIDILNQEQAKFDLLAKEIKRRKRSFTLYSDELKERIRNAQMNQINAKII